MSDCDTLVTIGLPVYNGEPFLREALDSLLAQHHKNFELLISDNASTDDTQQICLEYAKRDSRIRYCRNAENLGPQPNFNGLLARAKGEYFIWAAHDDVFEPAYLSTLARLLDDNPEAVLAFSAFDSIDVHGNELRKLPKIFDLPADNTFRRLKNYLQQHEYLGKANLFCGLMRRRAIEEAGGCRLWGRGEWGADMLIVFRVLSLGGVLIADETLFHKRNVLASGPPLSAESITSGLDYSTVSEQRGYLAGYGNIISSVESLSAIEKMMLRIVLWRRLSRVYWYGLRDGFVPNISQRLVALEERIKSGFKRRIKVLLVNARRLF